MKILCNAYPWSGQIDFTQSLIRSLNHDYNNKAQWVEKDNWITWKQEAIIFLPKYDDVTLCTIIKNPEESIATNVDKILSGYNGQKILGKDFSEGSWINPTEKLIDRDYKIIEYETKMYLSYIECMIKSKNKILILNYNDYKNNTLDICMKVFDAAKVSLDKINKENIIFQDTINHKQSVLYNQILEVINNQEELNAIRTRLELVTSTVTG